MNRKQTATASRFKSAPRRGKNEESTDEKLLPFVVNIKDPADFKTSPFFFNMILTGVQRKLRKLI
jgi:hypothetical protein